MNVIVIESKWRN